MNFKWYKDKKVIITGGLGFIGSNLAIALCNLGARVTSVDSMIPHYGGNLFNINGYKHKIKVNIADVRDKYAMGALVRGYDIMFNLAGTLSHIDSITDPHTDLEINCVSQLSILEACKKFNKEIRIVYAGTRGQYGKIRYTPVDENHPLIPTDVNGINKNAGEQYHILYYEIHDMKCCSLRLTNTYGPRHQMRHHKQGIINWFIRLAIDGAPITLFDKGEIKRDVNYVDDVVDALLRTGQSTKVWGNVYNVGGTSHTLREIAEEIVSIANSGSIQYSEYPANLKRIEIGSYRADYSKIKKELHWSPKISLHTGLSQTIEYYKKYHRHYWGTV